jgi:hypothetical protein
VAGLFLLNIGVTTKKAAFLWMWLSYTFLEALLIAVIPILKGKSHVKKIFIRSKKI